jgi:uncharacterized membrane protein YvbJ
LQAATSRENLGKRLTRPSAYNPRPCGKLLFEDSMRESTSENEKELREQNELREEDARWHVIYVAVVVFAALVITALYLFSRWFSS